MDMPSIVPPVMFTLLAFCVAIDPSSSAVLAPDAVVAPVPPYAIPIAVPCHTPVAIVPTDVRLDEVTPEPRVLELKTEVPLI